MSEPFHILIVDDEAELRKSLRAFMEKQGAVVTECDDGRKAVECVGREEFDLVLMDVRMPEMDGLQALEHIKKASPSTMIVMVTAHGNIDDAKRAIREGAFDYLEKPLREEGILGLLDKVNQSRGYAEKAMFSAPVLTPETHEKFVGESGEMKRIFALISRLTHLTTSVLIRGENGTGKELVAKAIHYNSPRKDKPFVAVNCAAIPENLIESEFFGHEKGAFTGADSRKIGKFQYATGGTLFLDEIGDISLSMQVKLLRVLQDKEFTPVGSNRAVKADVRILAATNRPLEEMIKQSKFREDLFYRLNVMPIYLPPLRERLQDLEALVYHFIEQFNQLHQRHIKGVTPEALEKMKNYPWPGNIRELENAIEYSFIIETTDHVQKESLPPSVLTGAAISPSGAVIDSAYRMNKETFERDFIVQALKQNKGRINQTAENAGIPKNTLLRKIKKYGISAKDYGDSSDESE